MKTCPFCKRDDLNDQATRCPHCAGNIAQWEMYHEEIKLPPWGWVLIVLGLLAAAGVGLLWLAHH